MSLRPVRREQTPVSLTALLERFELPPAVIQIPPSTRSSTQPSTPQPSTPQPSTPRPPTPRPPGTSPAVPFHTPTQVLEQSSVHAVRLNKRHHGDASQPSKKRQKRDEPIIIQDPVLTNVPATLARCQQVDAAEPMLVFYDLETTGFALTSGITQIAASAYLYDTASEDMILLESFNQYSYPPGPIPAIVSKITGITLQVLEDENAKQEPQAVLRFLKWVTSLRSIHSRTTVAIAHNGDKFDLPILWNAMDRMMECPDVHSLLTSSVIHHSVVRTEDGSKVPRVRCIFPFNFAIDTLTASKHLPRFRHPQSKRLGSLFDVVATDQDRAGMPLTAAHRADYDTAMMVVLYFRCFASQRKRLQQPISSLVKAYNARPKTTTFITLHTI